MFQKTIKILLVEDDELDVKHVCRFLSDTDDYKADYKIESVLSRSEALEKLQHTNYNLILLDLNLPDSSGLSTVKVISSYTNTPLVILTGAHDQEIALEALNLGAQDFLVKGQFNSDSLKRSIRYALARNKVEVELRRSNADLKIFSEAASHDLKAPVKGILSFAQLIKEDYRNALDKEVLNNIHSIEKRAFRMHDLIDSLLEYAKLGKGDNAYERIELKSFIEEICEDLDEAIKRTGAVITVGDLVSIRAIPIQMRRLFQNLIENALKFVKKDTIPKIFIESIRNHSKLEIRVSDNGIGFESKQAVEIFEPFKRMVSRDAFEGSGLGLAMCKRIVDAHGGSIRAESKPGKGSTFFVSLPYHPHRRP